MTKTASFLGLAALVATATVATFSSCSEGGRVVGQRTFLWHAGDANDSPLPPDVANPFRGRVAPTKARIGFFAGIDPRYGFFLSDAFSTAPGSIRHFEGDPSLPVPFSGRVDPLDPELDRIFDAPATVWTGLVEPDGSFSPTDSNPGPGFMAQTLRSTFPDDFGGDYSGEVPCEDPSSFVADLIRNGESAPTQGRDCIWGSVNVDPDNPDPESVDLTDITLASPGDPVYTDPFVLGITRMTGGVDELPFRPAPDRSVLEPGNDGSLAQGLFHPTRGMRTGVAMDYERNVDPTTGRPLVARVGNGGIGSCSSAGQVSRALVPNFYANRGFGLPDIDPSLQSYSTALASHPISVTTGIVVDSPTVLGGPVRGGIGSDADCLRPGGAPGESNALVDFGDGTDDDLAETNALANHHANLGVFASLCRATRPAFPAVSRDTCPFSFFNSAGVLLPGLLPVPFSELITISLAGTRGGGGSTSVFSVFGTRLQYPEADFTPPLASLAALFNDPAAPLYDRNGDGGIGLGPNDAADCSAGRPLCDLAGFDGFDGRVAIVSNPVLSPPRPDGSQVNFQTLDNSLTNEQRALAGCGPFYGTRCDSSANVNPIECPLGAPPGICTPGLLDPTPRHYAQAGGLDPLNSEASALLESVRAPTDLTSASSSDPQPGTVGSSAALVCMRRLAGGELVRLPGCRGVKSYTVVDDSDGLRVELETDAGYLPSVDGCVIGDKLVRSDGEEVPVVLTGEVSAQLAAEFPLCNAALRERAVPSFTLGDASMPIGPDNPLYNIDGTPNMVVNAARTGVCDGAFFGKDEPGVPASNGMGTDAMGRPLDPITPNGQINFTLCESELVTLETAPLVHPLAGCVDSPVWFDARADNEPGSGDHASTGPAPYGGCEFYYERDPVEELLVGTAQLLRSEFAALSWNLVMSLAATSCDASSVEIDPFDGVPPRGGAGSGQGLPIGAIGAFRENPECFDAERPYTPGRCSFTTPQLCRNVRAFLGIAPPLQADGGVGDDDGDGTPADGDASGVIGDAPCATGQVLACDDNCAEQLNTGQVNSNGGESGDDFGNLCDPDLDDDGDIDADDQALQFDCFVDGASSQIDCADADLVGDSLTRDPDPDETAVNGFDRLQLLRYLRDPGSAPGSAPAM